MTSPPTRTLTPTTFLLRLHAVAPLFGARSLSRQDGPAPQPCVVLLRRPSLSARTDKSPGPVGRPRARAECAPQRRTLHASALGPLDAPAASSSCSAGECCGWCGAPAGWAVPPRHSSPHSRLASRPPCAGASRPVFVASLPRPVPQAQPDVQHVHSSLRRLPCAPFAGHGRTPRPCLPLLADAAPHRLPLSCPQAAMARPARRHLAHELPLPSEPDVLAPAPGPSPSRGGSGSNSSGVFEYGPGGCAPQGALCIEGRRPDEVLGCCEGLVCTWHNESNRYYIW